MSNYRELMYDLGINARRTGKVKCPKCSHTRKKKSDPCLSINVEEGWYKCHNPGCDFSGVVGREKEKVEKEYVRPKFVNNTSLSEKFVNYFFKRGLTQKTIIDMKISEGIEFMPQVYSAAFDKALEENKTEQEAKQIASAKAKVNTMQFPYIRNGEVINVKYRDGKKNFKMSKGCELILYNLDSIKDSKEAIIVEGEFDALSFVECGIKHVLSVPNGASLSTSPDLEYLDNCIEHLEHLEKIILATDADEAGNKLRDELARRLGYERCFKLDLQDCKDSNEYLQKYGPTKLAERIRPENLSPFPMHGVLLAKDVFSDVDRIMEKGLERGDTSGFKKMDELISWVPGLLCVVTGIPNHGKSPFVLQNQVMLSLKYGYKWAMFTPEHKPLGMFIVKIIELISGKFSRTKRITENEREAAKEWINEHFFFIEPEDDDCTLDNILTKARMLVKRKGINGFVIDPWNKLEHNMEKGDNETNYISKSLDEVIRFLQKNSVLGFIVAHPTKVRKESLKPDSQFVVPDLYSISGSANWYNKADYGITFYRNYELNRNEVHVQKVKWEHLGKPGKVMMQYNMNNSRFIESGDNWDNSNWLFPKGMQTDMFLENNLPVVNEKKESKIEYTYDDEAEDPPF